MKLRNVISHSCYGFKSLMDSRNPYQLSIFNCQLTYVVANTNGLKLHR